MLYAKVARRRRRWVLGLRRRPFAQRTPASTSESQVFGLTFNRFLNRFPEPISEGLLVPEVRIFTWFLIKEVQQKHSLGLCVKHISSSQIMVDEHYVPHLKGTLVTSTPDLVKRNYEAIAELLLQIFRRDEADLPPSLANFMGLIQGSLTPDEVYLVGRHVAILPSPLLAAFIIGLVLIPQSLTPDERRIVFDIIDSVNVGENFYDAIRNDLKFDVLRKMFESGYTEGGPKDFGLEFRAKCPLLKSRENSLLFRNSVQHCGVKKRPLPRRKDKAYLDWRKENKSRRICHRWAYDKVPDPGNKVEIMLGLLFSAYPKFLHELQNALSLEGALHYFCINPVDHHAF